MALITMLSAKGSPGVTTTVAGLATTWPGPVLVVDADPSGGDLVPGWLGYWSANGSIQPCADVASFAWATRELVSVPSEGFAGHVQPVPGAGHARLLAGVTNRAQAAAVGEDGWRRVASAARDLTRDGGPDVLIDAGRWGPDTAWPLITEADLVLLAVRPSLRHVQAALPIARRLHEAVPTDHFGLAVCATAPRSAQLVARVLGSPLVLELPEESDGARVFSEGTRRHHDSEHCPLHQATRKAAQRFHTWLDPRVRYNSPDSGPLSMLRSQGDAA